MIERYDKDNAYEILVSDDDAGCREAVRDALETQGYCPHVASCGQEAIEYVQQNLVHAIIVDMNMPDLTGLETVNIIRAEVHIAIPSILMSADTSPDLKVRAMSAHVESFMPKPVNLFVLRNILNKILRKYYESDGE